ncbi:hypothetical protein CEXT_540301 [Caerostris extrusa]|uniref:Uncharacterized protein n=1 Tax=Caerostris extrusa TaxID=172846 RepID=A0AAV4Y989_CAEEX|nr:hypothetical protein CEXT_540301 [Caerostris extrusa]
MYDDDDDESAYDTPFKRMGSEFLGKRSRDDDEHFLGDDVDRSELFESEKRMGSEFLGRKRRQTKTPDRQAGFRSVGENLQFLSTLLKYNKTTSDTLKDEKEEKILDYTVACCAWNYMSISSSESSQWTMHDPEEAYSPDWVQDRPDKRLSEFLGGPGKRVSEFLGGPGKRVSEFLGGPGKRVSNF